MKLSERLTLKQWSAANVAIAHAEADAEDWESTKDPAAKELRQGVEVLKELVAMHLPSNIYRVRKEVRNGND
jgi:hypothetical protein